MIAERKLWTYECGMDMMLSLLNPVLNPTPEEQERIQDNMTTTQRKMVLWGGPKPVSVFSELVQYIYSQSAMNLEISPQITSRLIGHYMMAVREDLGHEDSDIVTARLLLEVFIIDVDAVLGE